MATDESQICPEPNGIYNGFFLGNGDLIMKSVKCAVLLLMTEPAAVPDLLDVARAVKRLWLLQRRSGAPAHCSSP